MADGPILPTEVTDHVGWFDRFAEWASLVASRASFFNACVLIVVAWLIEGFVDSLSGKGFRYFLDDKFQLQINTLTTILTFLLVALLQNSQTRKDNATQHKLNAIAQAQRVQMECMAESSSDDWKQRLACEIEELEAAVGLEQKESA